MSTYRKVAALAVAGIVILGVSAPAVAKKPSKTKKAKTAVTKIDFHLDDHSVAPGDAVTGTVTVWTRDGREWVALPATMLDLTLDDVSVGTVVTDALGTATVTVSSIDLGEHVVKVAYAGDATHKPAQRAQGFEVTLTPEETEDELEDGTGL